PPDLFGGIASCRGVLRSACECCVHGVGQAQVRAGRDPAHVGGMAERKTRRWVAKVSTVSTHPPAGLFTKDAETIARTLASRKVSPKGPASGMRMLTYFVNRGG